MTEKLNMLIIQSCSTASPNLNKSYHMVSKGYRVKLYSSPALSPPKSFKKLNAELKIKMNPIKVSEKVSSDRLYPF